MVAKVHSASIRLFTLDDVEQATRRKKTTLRTDIREGRLEVIRLGRQVRVTENSLRNFIAGKRGPKETA
jgi:hypothetical protein